jgi:hypothetical protein
MEHQEHPRDNASIARRLQIIRLELYGKNGGPLLSQRLGLPFPTWANYESGVPIPGAVFLSFLKVTNAHPLWLLHGIGPKYMAMTLGSLTDVSLKL